MAAAVTAVEEQEGAAAALEADGEGSIPVIERVGAVLVVNGHHFKLTEAAPGTDETMP